MNKHICSILCALVLVGCADIKQEHNVINRIITVSSNAYGSKTIMSDDRISYETGDRIHLFCEDVNSTLLQNSAENVNSFSGIIHGVGKSKLDARWYSAYPGGSYTISGSILSSSLKDTQTNPFDASANMMYSNVVVADYDEYAEEFPEMNFTMKQMMGIVKLSITNTTDEYKNDVIQSVKLSSESAVMSGDFTFDMSKKAANIALEFSSEGKKYVKSRFAGAVTLGKEVNHEVYLFVNPTVIPDLKVTVETNQHIFTREASSPVNLAAGFMMEISEPLDIKDFDPTIKPTPSPEKLQKTVVCWGDSYTDDRNAGGAPGGTAWLYSTYLQEMLRAVDPEWTVISAGIGGALTTGISARQGGLPIYTGSSTISVPTSGSAVSLGGIYTYNGSSYSSFWFRSGSENYSQSQINPCTIEGIEGVTFTITSSTIKVHSIEEGYSFGATIDIPARSRLFTYGATKLRHPALMIVYMGTNGGYSSNADLYQQHRNMIDYEKIDTENTEDYIVLGYHNWKFNSTYLNYFNSADCFGKADPDEPGISSEEKAKREATVAKDPIRRQHSRFIDQYSPLVLYDATYNYRTMLVRVGAAKSTADEDISDADKTYCETNKVWPASYRRATGDYHPGVYGAKAMACLIYDKMVELGYVE